MEQWLNLIAQNDFIITDFSTKIAFLKWHQSVPSVKIKIYTPEEILSAYLGEADEKAILKVMARFDLSFEHAKLLISNINFETLNYQTHKTELLSNVRQYLIENGFIYREPLAPLLFGNKNVLISPYLLHHKVLIRILKGLNTKVTSLPTLNTYKPQIAHYQSGVEETFDTLNKIAHLLENGVAHHQIKLYIPNKHYENLLRRLAPSFNILIQEEPRPLISFPKVYEILEKFLSGNLNLDAFLQALKTSTYSELKAFYNALLPYDFSGELTPAMRHIIDDLAKNEHLILTENEGLELIHVLPQFSQEDTYYFFMNFVQETAPTIRKLSPYLSLKERQLLSLLDPEAIGQMDELQITTSLLNIPNLILSSAPIFGDEVFSPSPLLLKLGLTSEVAPIPPIFYSQNYLNYLTGYRLDQRQTYNVIDPDLSSLYYSNFYHREYASFDYRFKGITYLHPRISLSFSSINLYQNLPFDYFAENILNLKDNRHSYHLLYGTFVHKVLEQSEDEESFEYCFYHYLDQFDFSIKEKFFIENRKAIVKGAYDFFANYRRQVKPLKIINEQLVKLTFEEGFDFVGRLDRVLLFEKNGVSTAVILDFKTGSATSRPDYYEYGLDLQLPLYGLLLRQDPALSTYKPGALVISSMKIDNYLLGHEDLLKSTLEKSLRFKGLIINHPQILTVLDPNYEESAFYHGVRFVKSKGEMTGVVEPDKLNEYIVTAEKMIKETHAAIIRNEFPVRVKLINGKLSGGYSAFREISYLPEGEYGGDEDGDE